MRDGFVRTSCLQREREREREVMGREDGRRSTSSANKSHFTARLLRLSPITSLPANIGRDIDSNLSVSGQMLSSSPATSFKVRVPSIFLLFPFFWKAT